MTKWVKIKSIYRDSEYYLAYGALKTFTTVIDNQKYNVSIDVIKCSDDEITFRMHGDLTSINQLITAFIVAHGNKFKITQGFWRIYWEG